MFAGSTGRDENWFWSPLDHIGVWWSRTRLDVPQETSTQHLVASVDPGARCSFKANFHVPSASPGRYLITVLAYGGDGFGWMGVRKFFVTR